MAGSIASIEPATGESLWTGEIGDAAQEVAAARAAWAGWAAKPLTVRAETLRRFANVVRQHKDKFSDLIARETGKPLWESQTEVDAVVNKVDISISAYSERTSQRRLEGALGAKVAVRHKPHGVLAVLGPYNFPAHLPNGHIVPALLAGNAVVFKPSEKTPAVGEYLVKLFHEAGVPEGVPACRSTGNSPRPRTRSSRWSLAATTRWSSGICRTPTPRRLSPANPPS
jgi:succinylglutamic semialdehyde dehydrogenase